MATLQPLYNHCGWKKWLLGSFTTSVGCEILLFWLSIRCILAMQWPYIRPVWLIRRTVHGASEQSTKVCFDKIYSDYHLHKLQIWMVYIPHKLMQSDFLERRIKIKSYQPFWCWNFLITHEFGQIFSSVALKVCCCLKPSGYQTEKIIFMA